MLDGNFYKTSDVSIHYAEGPENGPELVMLHGAGGRWQPFQSIFPFLLNIWHIYALDFRGHGKSSRVPGGYRYENYTRDVIDFVREKIGKPVVVWGQSMGASIAIQLAATEPELVRALVVAEPTVDFSEIDDSRPLYTLFRDLATSSLSAEEIKAKLAIVPLVTPGEELAKAIDVMGEGFITDISRNVFAVDPEVWDSILDGRAYENHVVNDLYKQVSCPVLFFQGNPDMAVGGLDHETAGHGVSLISDCKHIYIENAGHILHHDQPEAVAKAAMEFLKPFL